MDDLDKMIYEEEGLPLPQENTKPKDELDQLIEEEEGSQAIAYNAAIAGGINTNPDRQADVKKLSDQMKVPTSFVDRNYDMIKTEEKKRKLKDLSASNPNVAAWATDPNKVGMIQDDLDSVTKLDSTATRFKVADVDPYSYLGSAGRQVRAGQLDIESGALLYLASESDSPDQYIDMFIERQNKIQELQGQMTKGYMDFLNQSQKESIESSEAWKQFKEAWNSDKEEKLLERISDLGGKGIDAASELFDQFALYAKNPEDTAVMLSRSIPLMAYPMMAAAAAGKGGAVAGGAVGSLIPGVGTAVGATAGGTVAGLGSMAASSGVLNYVTSVKDFLAKDHNIDLSNKEQILAALKNPEIVNQIKDKAKRRAVTMAAIQTLFSGASFLAGKEALKAGATITQRVSAGGKMMAAEGLSEGFEEAGGQLAAEQGDFSKLDTDELIGEFMGGAFLFGLGKGVDFTAQTIRGGLSKNTVEAVEQTQQLQGKAQEAMAFHNDLRETVENYNQSKLKDRSSEAAGEILNTSSGAAPVYFQAEEFVDHWKKLGENALDKADELLPGGRSTLVKAQEEGSPLKVSLGDFVTKFSQEESFDQLVNITRKDMMGLSIGEAQAVSANIPNLLNELSKEAKVELDSRKQAMAEIAEIEASVEQEAIAAGRAKDEAKATAKLLSQLLKVTNKITGVSPKTWFEQNKVRQMAAEKAPAEGIFQQEMGGFTFKADEKLYPGADKISEVVKVKLNPLKGAETAKKNLASLKKYLNKDSVVGEYTLPAATIKNFLDRATERTIPDMGAVDTKKIKRSQNKAKAEAHVVKNLPALLEASVPVIETKKGTVKRYAIGNVEGVDVGVKFEVDKDGKVVDIEVASQAASQVLGQGEAPTKASLAEFQKIVNAGRSNKELKLFQKDAIDKINKDSLGFYSKLQNEVEKMDFKQIPAKDLATRLPKIVGIKQEELEWSGVLDFLKGVEGKVTKEEVMDFLEKGGVKLEEVTLGAAGTPVEMGAEIFSVFNDDGDHLGDFLEEFNARQSIEVFKEEYGEGGYHIQKGEFDGQTLEDVEEAVGSGGLTKYSKYTLPGGENYREVLLTLPPKNKETFVTYRVLDPDGMKIDEFRTREMAEQEIVNNGLEGYTIEEKYYGDLPAEPTYSSSHWDEDNVLAHFRLNDRTSPDGKKVLFIEEIQSDWHQEGRKKGYKGGEQARLKALEKAESDFFNYVEMLKEKYGASKAFTEWTPQEKSEHKRLNEEVNLYLSEGARPESAAVPDAPFKNTETWALLAFKRILNMAALQGYDQVSWAPGQVHADRYDLSKQISRVTYERGTLQAYDLGNRRVLAKSDVAPEAIQDYIGKEAAERLLAEEAGVKDLDGQVEFYELAGENLKVGGEGMIGFYDKLLPKAVQKYVSKLDKESKVEIPKKQIAVDTSKEETTIASIDEKLDIIRDDINGLSREVDQLVEKNLSEFSRDQREELITSWGALQDAKQELKDATDPQEVTRWKRNISNLEKALKDITEDQVKTLKAIDKVEKDISDLKTEKRKLEIKRETARQKKQSKSATDKSQESWTLPLTDKLKEEVLKGQVLFQQDEAARGFLDLSKPNELLIGYLKDANRSTGLHEMGHVFLEYMKAMNSYLDANVKDLDITQQTFKKDVETTLKALGVNSLEEIATPHHESFARLFEAYLMEGKAPNAELQSLFTQFKTWLKNIYASIKGLAASAGFDVNLTPEMTEVFDRLVATDEEIESNEDNMGYSNEELVSLMKAIGMTNQDEIDSILLAHDDAKSEAERILYKKNFEQMKRKEQAQYKADYTRLKEEIKPQVEAMPLYIAWDGVKENKFNTTDLKNYLSPEELKTFPRNLYSSEGGPVDQVADLVGFNPKELVSAILSSPKKEVFIEKMVQKEMDKIYPNYISPDNDTFLKAEALNAVTNEKRTQALRLEFELLLKNSPAEAKKVIERIAKLPSSKEVKAKAEKLVQGLTYKEVNPNYFRRTETKLRRDAGSQLVRGKFPEALKSKSKELLNHEVARNAQEVKADMDKRIAKLKDRLVKSDKDLVKKGHLDMIKSAQTVLANYGLLTDVQVDNLEVYKQQIKSYDPVAYNKVEGLVNVLIDIPAKPYTDLTVKEMEEVLTVAEVLYELAKDEKKLLIDGKKVDKEEAIQEMISNLDGIKSETIKKEDTKYKKFKGFVSSLHANMTRVEHLLGALDKDVAGPFKKYLWNRANESQTNYSNTLADYYKEINQILKDHFTGMLDDETKIDTSKYFPNVDPELAMLSKQELIMALLHSGNDSNKQKLLLGRNWGAMDFDGNLDSKAYDAFIQDMISKGILNKNHFDGIQKIWDMFEKLKPEIQKTHKQVYGYYFKEIEAKELDTPFGKYRGGYAPAVTDPMLVEKEASRQNELSTEQARSQFEMAHTPKGFTKERVDAYNKALSLDFRIIRTHVEKAVRFATLEGVVNDLNKVINNKVFADAMFQKNSTWGNEVLRPWLARLATQQTSVPSDTKAGREFTKVLGFLRKNANMQLMFMNVVNTVENLSDIPALFTKMKARSFGSSLKRYIGSPKEVTNFVKENSAYMKERMEDQIYEINDTYKDLTLKKSKLSTIQDELSKHTYVLQKALQNVVDITAWAGAYDERIAAGDSEVEASRYADSVIRTIMGSNRPIDLAKIETGNALQKMLLTFYSYFLNKGNLFYYSSKKNKAKFYALGILAPAVTAALLRRAVKGTWDENDDDEYLDDAFDVLAMSQIRYVTAMYPGGGVLTRFVEGQFTDKTYDDRLSISPLVGMIEGLKGPVNLLTKDEIKSRDVRDAMNFFGTLSGVPIGPTGRPIGFLIDLEQGKQKAESPLDYSRGLLTGRSGKD